MKSRLLSKSILENERLIRCGFMPTMLFQRLIMTADDCGRCPADAAVVKMRTFPTDAEVTEEEIKRSLVALAEEGLVLLYEVKGKRYLWLTGWDEHQVHRYFHPEYPPPAEGNVISPEDYANPRILNNNIIYNFKEEAKAKAKAKAEAEAKTEEKKEEEEISFPPQRVPPLSSSAEAERSPEGQAFGSGGVRAARDWERVNGERFDRFWSAYPRHEKKHEARRVFDKLSVDEALLAHMLDTVSRYRETDRWTREGGRYIPNAADWLRGRRWEDEIVEPPKVMEGSFDTDDFFAAALAAAERNFGRR